MKNAEYVEYVEWGEKRDERDNVWLRKSVGWVDWFTLEYLAKLEASCRAKVQSYTNLVYYVGELRKT